jgi:hypothetical protein
LTHHSALSTLHSALFTLHSPVSTLHSPLLLPRPLTVHLHRQINRHKVSGVTADLQQVVIVTGGNSGTGYITSRSLFHAGAKVYLACRNESKARDAIERIKAAPKPKAKPKPGSKTEYGVGELVYLNLDLMDLESVDRFADEFLRYVT